MVHKQEQEQQTALALHKLALDILSEEKYEQEIINLKKLSDLGDESSTKVLSYLSKEICESALDKLYDQNYIDAGRLFTKASNLGDSEAIYNLGMMHYHGAGVKQIPQLALRYLEKASVLGHAAAQHFLGNMYYGGEIVEQSYPKALELFEKAATQGHPGATLGAATIYYIGKEGVEQNYVKAAELFAKTIALKNSNNSNVDDNIITATYLLATMKLKGEGMPVNNGEAEELLKQNVARGDAASMRELGKLHFVGAAPVTQSFYLAKTLFEKAIKEGADAESMVALGVMLRDGNGVAQDLKGAEELFEDATKQHYPEAYSLLGHLYINDGRVEKAVEILREGVKYNDEESLYALFMHYYSEEKNPELADKLLEEARDLGHPNAQEMLDRLDHGSVNDIANYTFVGLPGLSFDYANNTAFGQE